MKTSTQNSLCARFIETLDENASSPVEKLIASALHSPPLEVEYNHLLNSISKELADEGELSPLQWLQVNSDFTAIKFLCYLQSNPSLLKDHQLDDTRLRDQQHWKELQIATALNALDAYIDGEQDKAVIPYQYDSGAAPLESKGYWSWAGLPHQRFHSFLGVLWGLLGALRNDQKLLAAAQKVAHWQLNTLDSCFKPHFGFFSQEEDTVPNDILAWNALLFQFTATFAGHAQMEYAAQKQLNLISKREKIPVLAVVIEKWLHEKRYMSSADKFDLEPRIYDASTALIGRRGEDYAILSTVYGGGTGLGSLKFRDLDIVTYGPQYRPYGDCRGFGIEASPHSQKKFPNLDISQSEDGFVVKGIAKLPGEKVHSSPYALFRNTSHSEKWVDIIQSFQEGVLNIETLFMGLDAFESLSFTFYVKAQQCRIDDKEIINPCSLDRYKGPLQTIYMIGHNAELVITPKFEHGTMEVIPLAGDQSFWGADFLIGYTISKQSPKYHWTVMQNPC